MNQFIKEIQEQPEMLERTLGYYHSREGKAFGCCLYSVDNR
jgi:hypothetical protein